MKITVKQYAMSLYDATRGKTDSQIKDVIVKFAEILKDNNDFSLTEKIITEFKKIFNIKEGIVEAEIISAGDLDKNIVKLLQGHISKITQAKEVNLKQTVDKDIFGGIIIKYGDKVFDNSLKNRLEQLKNEIEK